MSDDGKVIDLATRTTVATEPANQNAADIDAALAKLGQARALGSACVLALERQAADDDAHVAHVLGVARELLCSAGEDLDPRRRR